ncbi:hypothetical protein JX266_001441 [Neoarthrinium moseri]|uniref:uncharacterized protein n=1 Tax=Neoarthrinium moseri TaxID=1658444 RepID=UPI001FDE51A7|nr:uncharacterized protein JN550_001543 [Neoarthrinium moseri]KAI1854300.1 hypothetical protein JX266_001441 [Neoarthrinium moseri]KAI1876047.1 hypothetical protein JN550_001543 [Neoarthrinium moseri]
MSTEMYNGRRTSALYFQYLPELPAQPEPLSVLEVILSAYLSDYDEHQTDDPNDPEQLYIDLALNTALSASTDAKNRYGYAELRGLFFNITLHALLSDYKGPGLSSGVERSLDRWAEVCVRSMTIPEQMRFLLSLEREEEWTRAETAEEIRVQWWIFEGMGRRINEAADRLAERMLEDARRL